MMSVTSSSLPSSLAAGRRSLAAVQQRPYPIEPSYARACLWALVWVSPAIGLWLAGAMSWGSTTWLHAFLQKRLLVMLCGHWVCPLILWCFGSALLFLFEKQRLLAKEGLATAVLRSQALPRTLEMPGMAGGPAELYERLERQFLVLVSLAGRKNLLLQRCRSALLAQGGTTLESALAEVEHAQMASSYSLARYIVWAIPMLGLIGTVLGISEAVAHFANAMHDPSGASGGLTSALQQHLPLVTQGLASAFDATFLALLLSLPVMLFVTWLEKQEEGYLLALDEAWHDEVLPRLPVARTISSPTLGAAPLLTAPVGFGGGEPQMTAELHLLSLQVRALQETIAELGVQLAPRAPEPVPELAAPQASGVSLRSINIAQQS